MREKRKKMTQPNQPQNQVPDHRFQELQEQIRKLADRNQQLEGTINYMAQQSRVPQPPPNQQPDPGAELFKPDVNEAIDKKISRQLEAERVQFRNAFNGMADQTDHLKFQVQYGVDTYKKNAQAIEAIRQQRMQQTGQYLTREEAYKQVYFEENARKPKENPAAPQQVAPMFDPYTQTWVTPQGQPAQAPVQAQTPQQQPPAQTQPQVPLDVLPQVQPLPQNVQTYHPQDNDFGLPPQDVPAPGMSGAQSPSQLGPLDLSSDEKALDDWAKKYESVRF